MNSMTHYKPVILSKRVLRVNSINERENQKLREEIDRLDFEQTQKTISLRNDVTGLKRALTKIQSVRAKMELGIERRRHLNEHGIKITTREIDIDEFVTGIDQFVLCEKPNSKPRKALSADARTSYKDRLTRGTKSAPGNQYLAFTLQGERNITETLDIEQESRSNVPKISSTLAPFAERPKYQFREIVPPFKGRPMEEVFKEREIEAKLLLEMKEKKDLRQRQVKYGRTRSQSKGTRSALPKETQKPNIPPEEEGDNRVTVVDHEIEIQDIEFSEIDRESLKYTVNREEADPDPVDAILPLSASDDGSASTGTTTSAAAIPIPDDTSAIDCDKAYQEATTANSLHCRDNNLSSNKSNLVVSPPDAWEREENLDVTSLDGEDVDELSQSKISMKTKWNELMGKIKQDLEDGKKSKMESKNVKMYKKIKKSKTKTSEKSGDVIYDARPDKAVTKGYSQMRLRSGKNMVSIFLPAFKNDSLLNGQVSSRAHVKSSFAAEDSRIKRETRIEGKRGS